MRRASPSPPPPPPRSWLGPGRRRLWKGAAASRPPHDARRVRGTDDAPGNTVTNSKHLADLLELDLAAIVHDLGLDDGRKLRRGRRILLGRCARAGGTGEIQVSGTLARSPKLVRGRFGGGAQGGESGRRSEALQAPPPSHSASAVARGAGLAALCAPTEGVERRPRTATAAARRDAPGVLRTTREMADIEIPAQTQERAVSVGLSDELKAPTTWAPRRTQSAVAYRKEAADRRFTLPFFLIRRQEQNHSATHDRCVAVFRAVEAGRYLVCRFN